MAAQGALAGQLLGLLTSDSNNPSTGTLAISASTTRLLLTWLQEDAQTLSKLKIFVSAVGGTLAATDMSFDLVDFAAGAISSTTTPNAAIETRTSVTTTPTGAAWVEATGFTTALTAGKKYGVVIKNANASPGTNNFTVRWTTGIADGSIPGSGAIGWHKAHSTDSGSTYGTGVQYVSGLRLEFA